MPGSELMLIDVSIWNSVLKIIIFITDEMNLFSFGVLLLNNFQLNFDMTPLRRAPRDSFYEDITQHCENWLIDIIVEPLNAYTSGHS